MRAFTLIELLAVIVIVGLLLATFVPYALSLRESANRVRCTSNLNKIWTAVRDSYMPANDLKWPRVRADVSTNSWTAFTGADDPNPFAAGSAVAPNDVTASLWLLVREGLAQPEWFICPSGGGTVDHILDAKGEQTVVKRRGNFRGPQNLNYGYATPFSTIGDYRLNDTLPARFALLADRAPSSDMLRDAAATGMRFNSLPKSFKRINSPNHGGAGQNVLFADGTVRFEWSPYCGVRKPTPTDSADPTDGDNIYTALAPSPLLPPNEPPANDPGVAGAGIGPAYRSDTLLVPGADYVAQKVTAAPRVADPSISPSAQEPATRGVAATASNVEPATTTPATEPTTQP